MKKLRIAQIAPLWFTVPPKKYGGIERVVAFLTDELVKKGHQVTLFAPPGSKTLGKLVTVYPKPLIEAGISWSNPFWNLKNLSAAYKYAQNGKFDVIHSHLDLWTLYFQDLVNTPTVITLHNAAVFSKREIRFAEWSAYWKHGRGLTAKHVYQQPALISPIER